MNQIIQRNDWFPFDWGYENNADFNINYIIAGDLGGTKTLLAVFEVENGHLTLKGWKKYASQEFSAFSDMLREFVREFSAFTIDRMVLGVAGPVVNQSVRLTNLRWTLQAEELAAAFKIPAVVLLNDLEATAYGLATLTEQELFPLQKVKKRQSGNMAILAPGTGLGQAGLSWNGQYMQPFATEGGHVLYSPSQTFDQHLLAMLQEKYELVTWEHVLSGRGIYDMYLFLTQISKDKATPSFHEGVLAADDPAAFISKAALEGSEKIASVTLQYFCMNLFACLTNLALQFKAMGGVYLGGGISPKILPIIQQMSMGQPFLKHPTMNALLAEIPVQVILNEHTALQGAAAFAGWKKI